MAARLVVALVLAVATGVLAFGAYQSSAPSSDSERACLSALRQELGLSSETDVDAVWASEDRDRVAAQWKYGSTRAGSGVMPVGRGDVSCEVDVDGVVQEILVEKYAGTP